MAEIGFDSRNFLTGKRFKVDEKQELRHSSIMHHTACSCDKTCKMENAKNY